MLISGDWWEMLLRLGLATIAGLMLGIEREVHGHDAGVRTNAIVALSSAMVTISAVLAFEEMSRRGASTDPLRVIQGIAQAIGFIAAGLIFVRGDSAVKNVTTAASLWMAAAIGIVAGLGQYRLFFVGTGLTLVLLLSDPLFRRIRRKRTPGSGE